MKENKSDKNSTIIYPQALDIPDVSKKAVAVTKDVPVTPLSVDKKPDPNRAYGFNAGKDYSALKRARGESNPYTGNIHGNFWNLTGIPWVAESGRKAVLTEWFWQPIRGQPRRVDTNELRRFSQTHWVYNCIQTILNQVTNLPWDIVPKKEISYDQAEKHIDEIKDFLADPNDNNESFNQILRSTLKDILEIDAGVIVKVFSRESYDFEMLEPKSGAPILRPSVCPECKGKGSTSPKLMLGKAARTVKSIDKFVNSIEWEKDDEGEFTIIKAEEGGKAEYRLNKRDYDEALEHSEEVILKLGLIDFSKAYVYSRKTKAYSWNTSCEYCDGTGRGRQITELYSRDGASFLKEVDKFGFVNGYWQYSFQIPAHPMWFNRAEIIYFQQNPRSMTPYGFSAVQAVINIVKPLEYSVQYNKKYFEEGAIPDGIISSKDANEDDMRRIQRIWEEETIGQPHRLIFFNRDLEFKPLIASSRELEFLDTQKWYFDQVISAFQLTPNELGMTEDVNRATAASQSEVAKRKAIKPLISMLEYAITNELIKGEFGFTDVEFKITVEDPINDKQNADLYTSYLTNGLMTVNEIRTEELGRAPVEWGEGQPNKQESFSDGGFSGFGGQSPDMIEQADPKEKIESREDHLEQIDRMQEEDAAVNYETLRPPQHEMYGNEGKEQVLAELYNPKKKDLRTQANEVSAKEKMNPDDSGMREVNLNRSDYSEIPSRQHISVVPPQERVKDIGERARTIQSVGHLDDRYPRNDQYIQASEQNVYNYTPNDLQCKNCGHETLAELEADGVKNNGRLQCTFCDTLYEIREPTSAEQKQLMRGGSDLGANINPELFGGETRNPSQREMEWKPHVPKPEGTTEIPDYAPGGEGQRSPEKPRPNTWTPKSIEATVMEKNQITKCPFCKSKQFEKGRNTFYKCDECNREWTDRIVIGKGRPLKNQRVDAGLYQGRPDLPKENLMENLLHDTAAPSRASYDDLNTLKGWIAFDYLPFLPELIGYMKDYNFPDLDDLTAAQKKKLNKLMLNAFKEGKGLRAITDEVNKIVKDPKRAKLIARTETTRIANEAKRMDYEKSDVEELEFITADDAKVDDKCRSLDGIRFEIKSSEGVIPVHPRCRCTWIAVV